MFARLSILGLLLISVLVGGWMGAHRFERPARLIFLSVGQGDCSVFEAGGTTVLIDVGPKTREGFDAGARIVVPRLRSLGVAKVALILLSHPDADHVGGLSAVMKAYPEARVGISDQFRTHEGLLATLREAGIDAQQVLWFGRRASASLGSFSLEIATPRWSAPANDNDGSMFVRLADGASSVVFSGDAPIYVEDQVLKETRWTGQILHAGHHGSRTASGLGWLTQVHPQIAVISCGRDNSFGHPHGSVLDALAKLGIEALRTDQDGDIQFLASKRGFIKP